MAASESDAPRSLHGRCESDRGEIDRLEGVAGEDGEKQADRQESGRDPAVACGEGLVDAPVFEEAADQTHGYAVLDLRRASRMARHAGVARAYAFASASEEKPLHW